MTKIFWPLLYSITWKWKGIILNHVTGAPVITMHFGTQNGLQCTWWRHQMEKISTLLAICAGNSPVIGEFPAQRPVMLSLMFSLICPWINGWVNNREAGDWRRQRAQYDVIAMDLYHQIPVYTAMILHLFRWWHLSNHHQAISWIKDDILYLTILALLKPQWNQTLPTQSG